MGVRSGFRDDDLIGILVDDQIRVVGDHIIVSPIVQVLRWWSIMTRSRNTSCKRPANLHRTAELIEWALTI